MAKNPKQKLRSQCDKLWFQRVMDLHGDDDYGTPCLACQENSAVQAHHFYYKSSYGHLRYDLGNGVPLCQKCHFVLHTQDPKKIEDQIIARRGLKWYNKLKKKSQEIKMSFQTIGYYRKTIESLKVLKHFD